MRVFFSRGWATLTLWASASALLSACGGGGGASSADSPAQTQAFALAAPVKQTHSGALQMSGNITGTATYQGQTFTLSGTMSMSSSAATLATQFNGQPAMQGGLNLIGSLSINGQTSPFSSSSNYYETADGIPLGSSSSTDYCVVSSYTPPPSTATLGAAGQVMSMNCYSDSSKTLASGTQIESYTLNAGTSPGTAILSVTDIELNPAGQQTSLSRIDFLIDANGNATLQQLSTSGVIDGVTVSFVLK